MAEQIDAVARNLVATTRRWTLTAGNGRPGIVTVLARRALPHVVGTIEGRPGRAQADDLPVEVVEIEDRDHLARGASPTGVSVRCRSELWSVPPFCDLPAEGHDDPARATMVQVRSTGFFGRVLDWWQAIDEDVVLAGGTGVAPRPPDITLDQPYRAHLAVRTGAASWRDALTGSDSHVQGSVPDIIQLASATARLPPISGLAAVVTPWALGLCEEAATTPSDPARPPEDPHGTWPWIPAWERLEVIDVHRSEGGPLLVLRAWSDDAGRPSSLVLPLRDIGDLAAIDRPDLLVTRSDLGLDGRLAETWRGTVGAALTRFG